MYWQTIWVLSYYRLMTVLNIEFLILTLSILGRCLTMMWTLQVHVEYRTQLRTVLLSQGSHLGYQELPLVLIFKQHCFLCWMCITEISQQSWKLFLFTLERILDQWWFQLYENLYSILLLNHSWASCLLSLWMGLI